MTPPRAWTRYAFAIMVLWTVAVGAALTWGWHRQYERAMEAARAEAINLRNKDVSILNWASEYGGVYVRAESAPAPGPWMSRIPDRDFLGADGRRLTLVNPASVLRQSMDRYAAEHGIRGRITGSRYFNPANAPDEWEARQLESFARGEKKEVWNVAEIDGRPHLRYLEALFMAPGCDRCHGILGYKTGDLRGAFGLVLPLAPHYERLADERGRQALWHVSIWLIGLAGLGASIKALRRRENQLHALNEALEARVTQRTAELSFREERERDFSKSDSDWHWETDAEHRFVYLSHNADQIYSLRRDQVLGKTREEILSRHGAVDPDRLRQHLACLAARQPFRNFEYFIGGENENGDWFSISGLPYFDAAGRFAGYRGTGSRITEQKRTERRLAEYQRRMSSLLDTTQEGFWFVDTEGRTLDVNPAMCGIIGRPREEILGRDIYAFVDGDNAEIFRAEMAARRLGKTGSYEISLRRPDGSLVPCINNATPTYDEAGRRTGSVGIWTDISERKVREVMLIEARSEAERANAAKSEFLSRMSHELRTPLNAIIGFSELLETVDADSLNEQQADNVAEIRKAGEHLLAQVNEILDLARIESGRIDLRPEPLAVADLVAECTAQIGHLARARHVAVETRLEPTLTVIGDRMRVRQVLLNLLSNAVKYNRDGGRIFVETRVEGDAARVAVTDTGHGIPSATITRLFRPFERLESSYQGIEGTGIGLALAKSLVVAMNGKIGVDSREGEGSVFWFELPRTAASPAAVSAPAEVGGTAGANGRILYIEDNPSNLKLVRKALATRGGILLLESRDAETGLEVARRERPDLILLDINLPGMDGFAALSVLRADPVTRDIPVVAVTANALPRDVERGIAAGFAHYLAKPINIAVLLQTIDRYLTSPPPAP